MCPCATDACALKVTLTGRFASSIRKVQEMNMSNRRFPIGTTARSGKEMAGKWHLAGSGYADDRRSNRARKYDVALCEPRYVVEIGLIRFTNTANGKRRHTNTLQLR